MSSSHRLIRFSASSRSGCASFREPIAAPSAATLAWSLSRIGRNSITFSPVPAPYGRDAAFLPFAFPLALREAAALVLDLDLVGDDCFFFEPGLLDFATVTLLAMMEGRRS